MENNTATKNELKTVNRKRQSPIDIRDDIAYSMSSLPPLTLIGHWLNDGEARMENDGTYPVIRLCGNRIPSIVKCGPLCDEYELDSVHFHWGDADCMGSEHSLNGTWFSMEAHAVHWNRKYRKFDECLKYQDGLCVLTYFFLVRDDCEYRSHTMLEKITCNLRHIVHAESATRIPANSLCWMRAATECQTYYFYEGSYNRGNFPECAIWIIFPNVIPIRSNQVAEFRKLKNHRCERIRCNRRRIQQLYNRKIYKVF